MRIRRVDTERGCERPPEGWIYFAKSPKYTKTTFIEGYLSRRMNRTNTIAMNQHYVQKIMDNPRTSCWNRMFVAEYVMAHPERFTLLGDATDDPDFNEYASHDFFREFRRRYAIRRRAAPCFFVSLHAPGRPSSRGGPTLTIGCTTAFI